MMCKDLLHNQYSSDKEYMSRAAFSIAPPPRPVCQGQGVIQRRHPGGLLNGCGTIVVDSSAGGDGSPFVDSQISEKTMSRREFGQVGSVVSAYVLVKTIDKQTYGYNVAARDGPEGYPVKKVLLREL